MPMPPFPQPPFTAAFTTILFASLLAWQHEMPSDDYAPGKKPARAAFFFEEAVGHYSEAHVLLRSNAQSAGAHSGSKQAEKLAWHCRGGAPLLPALCFSLTWRSARTDGAHS